MMELQPGLEVSQRAQLVLTERMQQSLNLLQTPGIELADLLREALSSNPFLEEETAAGIGPQEAEETRTPALSPCGGTGGQLLPELAARLCCR